MLRRLYQNLFKSADERIIQRFQTQVDAINARERDFETRSRADLCAQTAEFRTRIQTDTTAEREAYAEARGAVLEPHLSAAHRQTLKAAEERLRAAESRVLDELLVDAFAAVREACKRTLGKRHYDVQLLGGMVLQQGMIAEMKTGEGKTFVATLPLYLNALAGHGAHLITPNDYLSKVGLQLMGPIYHYLDVSAAVIQNQGAATDQGSFLFDPDHATTDDRFLSLRPIDRREAYAADITYGTNNEFGFDHLRDNMARDAQSRVMGGLYYAIVDEVDNILIDEARTPLIISGVARESSDLYRKFASLVRPLARDRDYTVAEKERTVSLTEEGLERIERALGVDNLYGSENAEMLPYLDNALRASVLYRRDVEYLVRNREVVIVDEFTGRMMEGRRFSEGLHQAIEAKEGVKVQRESMTLASITFQNLFRMYTKLAGMTGTAKTEEEELQGIYNLSVVSVPTYKPVIRDDFTDVVFRGRETKFREVVKEIHAMHKQGRPVLVGTVAIETSEHLSRLLKKARVPHQVLNAKNHEREATIIAQAGRAGAVTIATNMAGRGVDILLGGNAEGLAREALRRQKVDLLTISQQDWTLALDLLDRGEDPTSEIGVEWVQTLQTIHAQVAAERREILALGGLHVVGTERHESRRIDNQLRGRSGRLGDPGSSRFFLSLEDDLLVRFGGERVGGLMDRFKLDDAPIESGVIDRVIENAQVKVEGFHFDSRKNVLQYDEVMNEQRSAIYAQRNQILESDSIRTIMDALIGDMLTDLLDEMFEEEDPDYDIDTIKIRNLFPPHRTDLPLALWEAMEMDEARELEQDEAHTSLLHGAQALYARNLERVGQENEAVYQRFLSLSALDVIDTLWTRHLTDLDHLREGIGLRALAQIQPIVAYKQEAFQMFTLLQRDIRDQICQRALALRINQAEPAPRTTRFDNIRMTHSNGANPPAPVVTRKKRGPGRNDPCPCGSGRKYKHCCYRKNAVPAP